MYFFIDEWTVKRMARIQRIWKERDSVIMKDAFKVEYTALKRKIERTGIVVREQPNRLRFEVVGKVEVLETKLRCCPMYGTVLSVS